MHKKHKDASYSNFFCAFCAFCALCGVEETEAGHPNLFPQTLEQQVLEGLLVDRSFHLTTIRFQLFLDSVFQLVKHSCTHDGEHRVVQHSFETRQRVFEFACVERRAARKILFDIA